MKTIVYVWYDWPHITYTGVHREPSIPSTGQNAGLVSEEIPTLCHWKHP